MLRHHQPVGESQIPTRIAENMDLMTWMKCKAFTSSSLSGSDENRYRRHAQEPVCTAIGYEKPARKSEYRIEVHIPALGIYLYLMSHTLVFFSYLSRSDISFKSNHTYHIFERHYLSTCLLGTRTST